MDKTRYQANILTPEGVVDIGAEVEMNLGDPPQPARIRVAVEGPASNDTLQAMLAMANELLHISALQAKQAALAEQCRKIMDGGGVTP